MTELVQRHKRQRVFVDQFAALLGGVETKRELLSLVLAICREFARGQRLRHFLGLETRDQSLHIFPIGVLFAYYCHNPFHFNGDSREHVCRFLQSFALADAVLVSVHRGYDALQVEHIGVLVKFQAYHYDEKYNYVS